MSASASAPVTPAERAKRWRAKQKNEDPDFHTKEKERVKNIRKTSEPYRKKERVRKYGTKVALIYRWATEANLGFGISIVDALIREFSDFDWLNLSYDRGILQSSQDMKEEISSMLHSVDDIVLVLFSGCLTRCADMDDFLAWEISEAFESGNTIHYLLVDTAIEDIHEEIDGWPEERRDMKQLLMSAMTTQFITCVNTVSLKEEATVLFQSLRSKKYNA